MSKAFRSGDMKSLRTLGWLAAYEGFTLLMGALSLRSPERDHLDGVPPLTTRDIMVSTHLYAYAFLATGVIFALVFMRLWKGSNKRR